MNNTFENENLVNNSNQSQTDNRLTQLTEKLINKTNEQIEELKSQLETLRKIDVEDENLLTIKVYDHSIDIDEIFEELDIIKFQKWLKLKEFLLNEENSLNCLEELYSELWDENKVEWILNNDYFYEEIDNLDEYDKSDIIENYMRVDHRQDQFIEEINDENNDYVRNKLLRQLYQKLHYSN